MTPHTDFPDTWFVMSSTLLRQVLRTSLLYPSCYGLRPNRALSCEPQRLRGPPEAAKLRFQTLPEVAWNALWLVSCSALLDGRPRGYGVGSSRARSLRATSSRCSSGRPSRPIESVSIRRRCSASSLGEVPRRSIE